MHVVPRKYIIRIFSGFWSVRFRISNRNWENILSQYLVKPFILKQDILQGLHLQTLTNRSFFYLLFVYINTMVDLLWCNKKNKLGYYLIMEYVFFLWTEKFWLQQSAAVQYRTKCAALGHTQLFGSEKTLFAIVVFLMQRLPMVQGSVWSSCVFLHFREAMLKWLHFQDTKDWGILFLNNTEARAGGVNYLFLERYSFISFNLDR